MKDKELWQDLGVIRAILTDGLNNLDKNQGTRIHLTAASEAVDDLFKKIGPHYNGDGHPHETSHTTRRLRIVYNKLRNIKPEQAREICGYAGYHLPGVSLIELGQAENVLAAVIREREEKRRIRGNNLGT